MRHPFTKSAVTHFLLVIGQDMMRLPLTKCAMLLTCYLLVIGKDDMSAFHKTFNVTHKLFKFVTGKDVMRLEFTKCAMSLTSCWSYIGKGVMRLSQKVQCHSLAIGHRKRCDETAFHKMWNVTHLLWVMGKKCDETAFHKMCNVIVTNNLLVIEKDVMRLLSTKCAMSLTTCWS